MAQTTSAGGPEHIFTTHVTRTKGQGINMDEIRVVILALERQRQVAPREESPA